ncbi:hypothetical protein AAHZ94_17600 [Streptomyces sp. HSW2009]|uniref:hypothetical protein n=1 Tax=Streptomyces sp. HSW2009 TaxID=3142890 RepID=UPI0032EC2D4E
MATGAATGAGIGADPSAATVTDPDPAIDPRAGAVTTPRTGAGPSEVAVGSADDSTARVGRRAL